MSFVRRCSRFVTDPEWVGYVFCRAGLKPKLIAPLTDDGQTANCQTYERQARRFRDGLQREIVDDKCLAWIDVIEAVEHCYAGSNGGRAGRRDFRHHIRRPIPRPLDSCIARIYRQTMRLEIERFAHDRCAAAIEEIESEISLAAGREKPLVI